MLAEACLGLILTQGLSFSYDNFQGLSVKLGGVPIVEGNSFQYYEPGWKKGYYSSSWKPLQITRRQDGSILVVFNSDDGLVLGQSVYTKTPNGIHEHSEFRWRGEKPVMVERSLGILWAPVLSGGKLNVDGIDPGSLSRSVQPGASYDDRVMARGSDFIFDAPMAVVEVKSSLPAILLDGRNDPIEWAEGRQVLWLGLGGIEIQPNNTAELEADWLVSPKPVARSADGLFVGSVSPLAPAVLPEPTPNPVIPAPKEVSTNGQSTRVGSGLAAGGEASLEPVVRSADAFLHHLWAADNGPSLPVTAQIGATGHGPGSYLLDVDGVGVKVVGADSEGVRNGLSTLVLLARPVDGHLTVPQGTIRDYPLTTWRGVHLFGGPKALQFQTKLLSRVLAPLKFNRAVLECERTDWNCLPGLKTDETMTREDLADLFREYRQADFEPIPLIQSFGHADWLFAYRRNLNLAMNPAEAYAMDVRKPEVKKMLERLWAEAVALLHPSTVHFGLDEVDMRGTAAEIGYTTRLWKSHVPFLTDLARREGVKSMLWSDVMLAPGEAPDAANARSVAEAKDRRSVLPKGTMVADWHYKDDPKPDHFTSLGLWASLGMSPVAASWYEPNNVRGQILAAQEVGGGTLQTTWAGYTSSEEGMVNSFEQFSAFVLAADYAWSGRKELPEKLPYRADDVFRRLYFSPPSVIRPSPGRAVLLPGASRSSIPIVIGPVRFMAGQPIQLHGATSSSALGAPDKLELHIGEKAQELVLALDCLAWVHGSEVLAEVEVRLADGKSVKQSIRYGEHVRGVEDPRSSLLAPRSGTVSAVRIALPAGSVVDSLVVRSVSPSAGIRLHGVTLL